MLDFFLPLLCCWQSSSFEFPFVDFLSPLTPFDSFSILLEDSPFSRSFLMVWFVSSFTPLFSNSDSLANSGSVSWYLSPQRINPNRFSSFSDKASEADNLIGYNKMVLIQMVFLKGIV